jgi:ADP-ribose pyrophosphatase YjhB (NUDIX family)
VVAIVVVRYQDQLLLGKRNNHPGQGRWTFFGGYVERGEKVEDAAIREVKEETLLDVQLAGLIGIYSQTGDTNILIAYQAHVLNEQINLQQMQAEEVSELALFPYDKLPELAFPIDKHILHDWQQLYH